MSYCVNCGVELGAAERKCPLCNVPVVNPKVPFDEKAEKPFPRNADTIKTIIDRKIFIISLGILMLIPSSICLITDYIRDQQLDWSLIASGGIFLWWVLVTTPFMFRKKIIIRITTIDLIVLCGFLYLIESMYKDTWFWPVGVPIAIMAYILINLIAIGIKYQLLKGLDIGASVLLFIALFCAEIELVLWIYYDLYEKVEFWSLYVIIPCVVIASLLIFLERKKRLKKELAKRFHV